ncbi:hypothetical protein DLAC_02287 [Tieghemostelium lacteum]|uniref:adenosylhomocysteine nucleosidase n=1 Tax=Tieghemostelium lacteum TaxID=361077 RepID=A0A152A4L2_TIELA|nr:hypothetical protein DLAC_02287 [Tieghemostelium lacteum]|eukprot:KYR01178.1 hypothetical protein DLAC_02287 [Tieghemostelium lacteum]
MTEEGKFKIGIMGAMNEEVKSIRENFTDITTETFGKREYTTGKLQGIDTVLVFSRWGKVAAASTVTTLLHHYKVNCLIFIGVAGALSQDLNVGDIVISDQLFQHDMDARPLCEKHQIPLTNDRLFKSNETLVQNATKSAALFIASINQTLSAITREKFSIIAPKVVTGKIATGDTFIHQSSQKLALKNDMPDTLAVEMEGAAVAQICHDYDIPFVVLRTISDKADHSAAIDFQAFISEVIPKYASGIVNEMYKQMKLN